MKCPFCTVPCGYKWCSYSKGDKVDLLEELRDLRIAFAKLEEENIKLLACVDSLLMPCEMYKVYGWDDRDGVINDAKKLLGEGA